MGNSDELFSCEDGRYAVTKRSKSEDPLVIALAVIGFFTVFFSIAYVIYKLIVKDDYKDVDDLADEFEEE